MAKIMAIMAWRNNVNMGNENQWQYVMAKYLAK
jgi:hypothetical protein